MYLARFIHTTFEEKFAIRKDKFDDEEGWRLANPIWGMGIDWDAEERKIRRFRRVKEKGVVFHEEMTAIHFEVGDYVRVNKEAIQVNKVIKTLDGAIEYYMDKETVTCLNTYETYFDEREKV